MINEKKEALTYSRPDFYNELKDLVKQYFESKNVSKYGNGSIVSKTIILSLVYFAPYVLLLTGVIESVWLMFILWGVMGVGMAGVGMAFMHDANHGTFSKHQKVNSLLSQSIFFLGGFPANWRYQHNILHHGYTNIDGHDDDIDPIGVLRFSPHKPLHKIHQWQHWYAWFFYGLLTLSWITIKDFIQYGRYKKMKGYVAKGKSAKQIFVSLIFSKVGYHLIFLVLPLILIPVSWYWIVLGFLMMHFISGLILSVVFQTAHVVPSSEFPLGDEYGNVENHWAVHQLLNSTNFAPKSRLLSWFIGGLNFQVEHHLFPQISHVHYKKLSPLVQKTALKYNLPYYITDNFFVAVYNHVKMLKHLGRA